MRDASALVDSRQVDISQRIPNIATFVAVQYIRQFADLFRDVSSLRAVVSPNHKEVCDGLGEPQTDIDHVGGQ